jgi:ribonuclease R
MSQAKYNMNNVGHFGLGFEFYAHFTSPIRRYPDLIIHRLLKNQVMPNSPYRLMSEEDLLTAGTILSAAEQRSTKAERQVQSIKKARFMQKFVGQELDGMISSVAKFGVFVLLREYDCDGLVRTDDLGNDRFEFNEENLRLVGQRTGKVYNIGDMVRIQVAAADPELGQVNFILAEGTEEEKAAAKEKYQGNSPSLRPLFAKADRQRSPEGRHKVAGRRQPAGQGPAKPAGRREPPRSFAKRQEKPSGKTQTKFQDKHQDRPKERPQEKPADRKEERRDEKPKSGSQYFFKGQNLVAPTSARSRKLQFADRSKLSFNVEESDEKKDAEPRQELKGGPSKNRQSDRKDAEKRSPTPDHSGGVRKTRVPRGRRKNKAR